MNMNSVLSFFGWLFTHLSEVAIWSIVVVAVFVLLVVFGRQARQWRNPPARTSDTDELGPEDITPRSSGPDGSMGSWM